MDGVDIIFYAVPVFILAMLAEMAWTASKGQHRYHLNDTLCSLTASILSSIVGVYTIGIISFSYHYIFTHYRLIDLRDTGAFTQIICWIVLVILQDGGYYWFHRIAHRCNIVWASHITHHSSEEYNFAVALRQSSLQQFFSWPVYLPLALLGFPPEWLGLVIGINLIYQFFIHTREVKKLPAWMESIFNTPSHHRVHHGSNSQYLDKNYGGMFIVWDKWFGTFEAEVEAVRYGITVPVKSFNPVWVNVHHYWFLMRVSLTAPTMWQAVRLWFAPPNWKPCWLQGDEGEASRGVVAEDGRLG